MVSNFDAPSFSLPGPRALLARLAFTLGGRKNARAVAPAVVFYHGIGERRRNPLLDADLVSVSDFRAQLKFFHRYRKVVPLSLVVDSLGERRTLDAAWIVLTFDDALASVREYAVPELDSLEMPYTIGVPCALPDTGRTIWEYEAACLVHRLHKRHRIADLSSTLRTSSATPDSGSRWRRTPLQVLRMLKRQLRDVVSSDERLAYLDGLIDAFDPSLREWILEDGRFELMSWAQLAELRRGHATLAAHGFYHHPHNKTLSDLARIRELTASRAALEANTDARCDAFIWPEGSVDPESIKAGTAHGYRAFLSTRPALVGQGTSLTDLPRISGQWPLAQFLRHLAETR